ncbi:hypothetical protein DAPPUDRAFT_242369 [Daphnia pulex]|uniref:Rho-GAP domain-containing protein n=1 Tax=Daphnia pulex TaxID=6669 RepID=E9GGH4_DAPPU|nr:hypothetical protein DAPPUDRAFT_242369 [Daphnia pulex]|eukprot:EFX81497.1 hypothetical protein DAPPUDRAFT_242369 [Daphnia pulex]
MPASKLGIVFGPTLLRTTEDSATLSSLVDTVHQTKVIELLVRHAETIFGPPDPASTSLMVAPSSSSASAALMASSSPVHRSSAQSPKVAEQQESPAVVAPGSSSSSSSTTSTASSLLFKVPVVRSISFLEKHRSKSRDAAVSNAATIISTPADRRSQQYLASEHREEVLLSGYARRQNFYLVFEEGLLGATSDDDLPDFLLPNDSSKMRKLPGYLRSGSAPKIFKSSLKDYHGLEGLRLRIITI